jgi:5-methylcytosine-specific restriction endonuclease McrA
MITTWRTTPLITEKGGITPLYSKIRSSKRMQKWRRDVFIRDGFKDWFSGCGGDLESHHIISFTYLLRKYNIKTLKEAEKCEELWDINNGVTMLKKSHKAYHNMWGKDNGYLRK